MRFIELLTITALVVAVANAAPTQDKREIIELDQPIDNKAFIFDPAKAKREAARRKKLHVKRSDGCCDGKHHLNKRCTDDCCGGKHNMHKRHNNKFLGLNLGGRLDLSAGGEAALPPLPNAQAQVQAQAQAAAQAGAQVAGQANQAAQAAQAATPVNRNDRNGDSVVVVVDAKHG